MQAPIYINRYAKKKPGSGYWYSVPYHSISMALFNRKQTPNFVGETYVIDFVSGTVCLIPDLKVGYHEVTVVDSEDKTASSVLYWNGDSWYTTKAQDGRPLSKSYVIRSVRFLGDI